MHQNPNKPKSVFILSEGFFSDIYSPACIEEIHALTEVVPMNLHADDWHEHREILKDVEYVFSGWGMAKMDADFLSAAPKLKHVFYAAGSVRGFYLEAARKSSVRISSAWRANAVPVAEFAHAAIILALKKFWRFNRTITAARKWEREISPPGAFGTTVGLISLGAIGRMVAQRLQAHDLEVVAYDPYVSDEAAAELGVRLVDLETLFKTSDVVSLHAPDLPVTQGMLTGAHFRSMQANASFINTARGQIINEPEMIEALKVRTDLDAILDVTATEPINADSPLWDLPNVVLTPHIAGSMKHECRRMGAYMLEEFKRYLSGETLQHEVTDKIFATMA